ncbi:thioredoxin-disulfide reductase [Patescibacteria group bacterium]
MSEVRNLIIIGSGPSGWASSIYTSRAFLKPLMFAGEKSGGQLMFTTEVENYPGFENGIMGPDLMTEMRKQAIRFGAEVIDKNITKVDFSQKPFKVWSGDDEYQSHAVVISTGAEAIMLGVPGEEKLLGRGVAVCAVCDAPFYKDKNTFVVGGGDAAIEDTLALTKFASSVTMLVRRDELRASKIMQKRVLENPKVKVMWNAEVKEVLGEQKLEKIVVLNNKDQNTSELEADGLFLAIGHRPMTDLFKDSLDLDDKGYLLTRLALSKQSGEMALNHLNEGGLVQYPTMTSVDGVFAAGDVVDFRYRQAITAAGYGAMAALDVEWYLEREIRIESAD